MTKSRNSSSEVPQEPVQEQFVKLFSEATRQAEEGRRLSSEQKAIKEEAQRKLFKLVNDDEKMGEIVEAFGMVDDEETHEGQEFVETVRAQVSKLTQRAMQNQAPAEGKGRAKKAA